MCEVGESEAMKCTRAEVFFKLAFVWTVLEGWQSLVRAGHIRQGLEKEIAAAHALTPAKFFEMTGQVKYQFSHSKAQFTCK